MVLRAVGRALERLNRALLERFPEEWVAVGSEGFSVATSLGLNVLFQYFLLTLFAPEVAGLYFAALGFAYLSALILDLGYLEIATRRLMDKIGFSHYTAAALMLSITTGGVGALFTSLEVWPFISATIMVGYMTYAYHSMGEYAKKLALDLAFSVGKFGLLVTAYFLRTNPYTALAISSLAIVPYLKYIKDALPTIKEMLHNWRLGLSARGAKLFATITNTGDSALIHLTLGPSAVAAYNILTFIPKKASLVSGRISTAVLPVRAREGKKLDTWTLAAAIYLAVALPLLIFPELYYMLFPQGPYSPLVIISGAVLPLAWIAYGELYRKEAFSYIGIISLISSAFVLASWGLLALAEGLSMERVFLGEVIGYLVFVLLSWKVLSHNH